VEARGLDPLALRLSFLQHRYRQQMNLTWQALEGADATIQRWRQLVAAWATEPSAAMPASTSSELLEFANDDLDFPRVINTLREVEKDDTVSAGSKFELFVFVDRLLGLDLARDVGKPVVAREIPADITALLALRAQARADKDWTAADRLRDELAERGFPVKDTPNGQELAD
jgi:cysteinyl-tRNA synthetase